MEKSLQSSINQKANHDEGEVDANAGIIYMLIASFCFALTGACTRILRNDIGPIELVFFRNLVGIPFIIYALCRIPAIQKGGKFALLVFRGVIGTIALYAFFYSISKIGLAVAITYQQSYPVFLAIMSIFAFGEKLEAKEWLAVLVGFAGICMIFFPQISVSTLSLKSNTIGFSNAVLTGSAYLSIRGLRDYYDTKVIVFSFMAAGIVLPIISMVIGHYFYNPDFDFIIEKWVWPQWRDLGWVLLLGIAALFGQIYLTKAFSHQKTGIIAAVGYSNIVFSILFGILLSDPIPYLITWMGILFVIICGLIIAFKKKTPLLPKA